MFVSCVSFITTSDTLPYMGTKFSLTLSRRHLGHHYRNMFQPVTSCDVWWRWWGSHRWYSKLRVPTRSPKPAAIGDGHATHFSLFPAKIKIYTNTYGRIRPQNPNFSNLCLSPILWAHCTPILSLELSPTHHYLTIPSPNGSKYNFKLNKV